MSGGAQWDALIVEQRGARVARNDESATTVFRTTGFAMSMGSIGRTGPSSKWHKRTWSKCARSNLVGPTSSGYSGGGVVAYEMACQLTAAEEAVALLALIDTMHPRIPVRRMSLASRLERLREEGLA